MRKVFDDNTMLAPWNVSRQTRRILIRVAEATVQLGVQTGHEVQPGLCQNHHTQYSAATLYG